MYPIGNTPQLINAGSADVVAMNSDGAVITTKSLTLAALTAYTFTINAAMLKSTTVPVVELGNGSNTQGVPVMATTTVAASGLGPGTLTVVIYNVHATQALNGTLVVYVYLLN
jgi:hypothetical protein